MRRIKIMYIIAAVLMLNLTSCNNKESKATTKATIKIDVNSDKEYQIVEGFGTSLAWWANIVGGWDMENPEDKEGRSKREVISEMIFDAKKGIGMNIVRYNIGGGDNPTHNHVKRIEAKIPGYKQKEEDQYNWESDKNQLWILQKAKELVKDNEFIVEVFSNSPPWYMTESGCSSGNEDSSKNNLKEDKYEEFAKYLVDVTKYINNDLGIKVDYIEPVNEPDTNYWQAYSEKQEGCHFDRGESQSKIYEETYKALEKEGLEGKIKLTGTDETSIDVQIQSFKKLSDLSKKVISKINTHAYEGDNRETLKEVADINNKKLWMSEVCMSNEAHNHNSMYGAMELSDAILRDMRDLKSEAWIIWQAVESEAENVLWDNNYGLIHAMYEDKEDLDFDYHIRNGLNSMRIERDKLYRGEYYLTKQYYVMGQFSKYIRPGYRIIDSNNSNSLVAISPDKSEMIVVLQNIGDVNVESTIDLGKKGIKKENIKAIRTSTKENMEKIKAFEVSDSNVIVELPPMSVTTLVVKLK